jgi:hypothetical protein
MKTLKILVPASLPFASRQTDTPLERGRHFFMEEIWKTIDGHKGIFEYSSLGRIKSVGRWVHCIRYNKPYSRFEPEKILKPKNDKGYLRIGLCINGRRIFRPVHRLIAMAFIPNPQNKPTVNHKNGIKTDNRVENLEWATISENTQHSFDNGLQLPRRGSDNIQSVPVAQFTMEGVWVRDWAGMGDIKRGLGLSQGSISNCIHGKTKSYSGYIWRKIT